MYFEVLVDLTRSSTCHICKGFILFNVYILQGNENLLN